jgi:hypothetical protein
MRRVFLRSALSFNLFEPTPNIRVKRISISVSPKCYQLLDTTRGLVRLETSVGTTRTEIEWRFV